jgi:ATP-dependent phosphofructokinase / diphosphate-dependent phosphofructokinase
VANLWTPNESITPCATAILQRMDEPTPSPHLRIGILTGGGDAPGLNAVIRAVVKSAANHNCETIGLEDSFNGLIEPNRWRRLTPRDVTGILRIGGTILGTTNKGNPFAYPGQTSEGTRDYSERCIQTFHHLSLDALVVIGGDGTLAIAHEFSRRGIPLVGVPKTIDNDIVGTTITFGFDSAVAYATDAIDRLHATAHAHSRVMVVEVMGRHAGWIALHSGIAGGADVILIPEIDFDLHKVAGHIKAREAMGARFSVVVVAEGAKPVGGAQQFVREKSKGVVEKLGGMGATVTAALEPLTGKSAGASCSGICSGAGRRPATIGCSRPVSVRAPSSWCSSAASTRWSPSIRRTSSPSRWPTSSAGCGWCRQISTCCERRARSGFRWGREWTAKETPRAHRDTSTPRRY